MQNEAGEGDARTSAVLQTAIDHDDAKCKMKIRRDNAMSQRVGREFRRILALFVCAVLLLGGLTPGLGQKAYAAEAEDERTETIPGNQLLTLDGTTPEGYDPNDTNNPYGVDYDPDGSGSGTILVPWDELMVMTENSNYEHPNEGIHSVKWLTGDAGEPDPKYEDVQNYNGDIFSRRFKTREDDTISVQDLVYVQSVSFDNTGSGRKSAVAYVGFQPSSSSYQLVVVDTANNNATKAVKLSAWVNEDGKDREYKPVFADFIETTIGSDNRFTWAADHYEAGNFLSITAGNYGAGHETVVVMATYVARSFTGSDDATVTLYYEYDLQGSVLVRQGLNFSGSYDTYPLEVGDGCKSENYLTTVSTASGDINGDDLDDLIVVLGKTDGTSRSDDPPKDMGETQMIVYYGAKENTYGGVYWHDTNTASLYRDYTEDKTDYRISFSSPGVAIGDVDGDGFNEIVVGGYRFVSESGVNQGKYDSKEQQLLGIYRHNAEGSLSRILLSEPEMNPLTEGGFYEEDTVHPRAAVATVAFNGQNGKDLIFFNGDILTYNTDADVSLTYRPEYFKHTDVGMGSVTVTNAWVSDVAVGNFDHNTVGREQVYFAVALKERSAEYYGYKVGMIGATYNDTEEMLGILTGSGFYSSDVDHDDYLLEDVDGYLSGSDYYTKYCSAQVVLTACDINDDGVRLRYRRKDVVYSDPKVEAVLQAAPYFEGMNEPGSTTYEISTIYGTSDTTTSSVDWGVGFTSEASGGLLGKVKITFEAGAAFNYSQEWTDEQETTYASSFETTDQNTVLIQRTPIVIYTYDLYDADKKMWANGALQVPVPLGPVWSQLGIADYNDFVDQYDAMVAYYKAQAEAAGNDYYPAKLYKIVDTDESPSETGEFLIDNEGDPAAYLRDWNNGDLTDPEKLSKTADFELGYAGTSKTQSWEFLDSHTEGASFSAGFSIAFSAQGGFEILIAQGTAGLSLSVDFLKGTGHYQTNAHSNAVSGTVTDINERALLNAGVPKETIRAYGFSWSFGRWYVNLGTNSTPQEEEANEDDPWSNVHSRPPVADNSHVPVYGYRITNLSLPPQPVKLSVSFDQTDEAFTLAWEDAVLGAADGYYVYQVLNGEYVRLNDERLAAGSSSWTLPLADADDSGGNLYCFVVTTAVDLAGSEGLEVESIWSNEVSYAVAGNGKDGNGIESIEMTGTEGLVDTYTITCTNGDSYDLKVTNGVGITEIKLTATSDDGLTNTYTAYLSDGTTTTFSINLVKGDPGLSAYEVAVENGFEGTVAEWLEQLGGSGGIGVTGIEYVGSKDNIDTYEIHYGDGSSFQFTVTNGLNGQDGADGKDGADGADGADGKDGVGIAGVELRGNGDLIVTLSDGTELNAGNLMDLFISGGTEEFRELYYGKDGKDGRDGKDGTSGNGVIPFGDVSEGDYFYESVVWAYTEKITSGTSGSTFSPLNICTRAQVVTFLWRAAGSPKPMTDVCPFEDVKETDYFYTPVLWAVGLGIVEGTSPTVFDPDLQCRNSHILTFIYRAVGEPGKTGAGQWYSDALRWAEASGLLEGTYTGTFRAEKECPRCNVVEYLYRYMKMH